eukprot:c11599_g1_i1 orf=71-565(+)
MASQEQKKGRTILVAVDEGEHSLNALQWALDNLGIGSLPDDHVVAVYVKSSYATLSGPAFVLTTDAINSIERYDNAVISKISARVNQMCSERKVPIEIKVLTGDPRDVITETTNAIKATLLVMGSHGFGVLKRALLGSVSDYCVHHVQCPVIIVKQPPEETQET